MMIEALRHLMTNKAVNLVSKIPWGGLWNPSARPSSGPIPTILSPTSLRRVNSSKHKSNFLLSVWFIKRTTVSIKKRAETKSGITCFYRARKPRCLQFLKSLRCKRNRIANRSNSTMISWWTKKRQKRVQSTYCRKLTNLQRAARPCRWLILWLLIHRLHIK